MGNVVRASSQILDFHEDTQLDLGVIYQPYHLGTRYCMLIYYKNGHTGMVYGAALDKGIIVVQQLMVKNCPPIDFSLGRDERSHSKVLSVDVQRSNLGRALLSSVHFNGRIQHQRLVGKKSQCL